MGRYYYIRCADKDGNNVEFDGKFWFGIQGSDDFEVIGFTRCEGQEMTWNGCGCNFRSDDMPEDYCEDCYGSYEEHKEAIKEEYGEEIDMYYESNMVGYYANHEYLYDKVCNMIKKYKNDGFDKFFKKQRIVAIEYGDSENKTIEAWCETQDTSNEILEKVARYELCKIIKFIFDLGCDRIYVDCEY